MRRAGRLAAQALDAVGRAVAPGVTTELGQDWRKNHSGRGGVPTFLGYRGYTASICASINEEVVHGIPHPKRILRDGDIVGIDVGATLDGFVGDTAATFPVGRISGRGSAAFQTTRNRWLRALRRRGWASDWAMCRGDSARGRGKRLFGGARFCGAWHRAEHARRALGSELRNGRDRAST
jgi:Xaa-Pro aminopeptidase